MLTKRSPKTPAVRFIVNANILSPTDPIVGPTVVGRSISVHSSVQEVPVCVAINPFATLETGS